VYAPGTHSAHLFCALFLLASCPLLVQEDSALAWTRLEAIGDTPTRRSGHSLTVVGGSALLFGGEWRTDFSSAGAALAHYYRTRGDKHLL
jgi:hypothetical protein